MPTSDKNQDRQTPQPSLLSITFHRDDGVVEWWGVYATELDEGRRWAEHELALRRRRKGAWHAEISDGWVDQESGATMGSGDVVAIVRLDNA